MVYLSILFSSIFITNILLVKLEGFPHLDQRQKFNDVVTNGLKLITSLLFTTLIVYPIYKYLLVSINWDFLLPVIAVLVSISINILINNLLKHTKIENKDNTIGFEFALSNSVLIAAVILVSSSSTYLMSLVTAVGFGLGHLLMMLFVLTAYPRLNAIHTPKAFKGIPLLLITLGLVSMIFLGLAGIL